MSSRLVGSEPRLKHIVALAGGQWVGVQNLGSLAPPLLLFNSPATGSTLAVKIPTEKFYDSDLVRDIRAHIGASDALFAAAKKGMMK